MLIRRTVEQNVRAPVPTVQKQRCVPEKPEAQGVEQMLKSLDRLLGASELEKRRLTGMSMLIRWDLNRCIRTG